MPRPRLHDESLRLKLLDTAGEILTSAGPDALSLRKLAAAAGTSTTAVYALFGNKAELLRALFVEGFSRLGERLGTVRPSADPIADILALGRAYRGSAVADPHLYSVMFGSPVPGFEPAEADWRHAEQTFQPLLDAVRRASAAGLLRDPDPGLIATALWANVHGLVALELRGAIPADGAAELFEAAIRASVDGWRSRR